MPGAHFLSHSHFPRRSVARLLTTAALTAAVTPMMGTPAVRRADAATGPFRRRVSLNAGWRFAGPLAGKDEARDYTGAFRDVDLPHTVTNLSWHRWDPASWDGFWRYHKEFDLDDLVARTEEEGTRYFLRFAGAMTAAYPWFNGRALDPHVGGYLPFSYEITDSVRGKGNRLDVVVDGGFDVNTPPNRPDDPASSIDLWQPAGLYRGVTLDALPANHVTDVFARPRDVLRPQRRRLDVETTVDIARPDKDLSVRITVYDGDFPVASEESAVREARRGGRHTVRASVGELTGVTLWSVDEPKLYRVVVTLLSGRTSVHEYETRIGFREAEFTTRGFLLNGERLQLFGSNRHHYFPFAGAAAGARLQYRDAAILKQHGHNMVRCSHYPQDESFLDACDELGLLVYEEAPGWGYVGDARWQERAVRDVHAMIVRDRNHPSIVVWGARLNETPDDRSLYARTQQAARELDPSRQTSGAMIEGRYDTDDFQQDVFSFNDYGTQRDGTPYPRLRPPREDLPYLVTEAVGTLSGPAKFYRRTDPVTAQHGQAVAHAMAHDQAAGDEHYCGLLGWAGFDYQSGNGNQSDGIKSPAVFDMFREPKLGAAIYTANVDPSVRGVIAPAFYWDFSGDFSVHTLGAEAMIASNADRLELFVDGVAFATLRPARERFPHLRHAPFLADLRDVDGSTTPELRIDAYRDGLPIASRTFSSDRGADRFEAAADTGELVADGADATRVVFRVVDAHGAVRPVREGTVELSVDGPVRLVGDNPFPLGQTGGVGAVWLRTRAGYPGRARLRLRHSTLGEQRVEVTVRGEPESAAT